MPSLPTLAPITPIGERDTFGAGAIGTDPFAGASLPLLPPMPTRELREEPAADGWAAAADEPTADEEKPERRRLFGRWSMKLPSLRPFRRGREEDAGADDSLAARDEPLAEVAALPTGQPLRFLAPPAAPPQSRVRALPPNRPARIERRTLPNPVIPVEDAVPVRPRRFGDF